MRNSDLSFTGSVPDYYDTYMVPLIFSEPADDLSDRVLSGPCASVLEVAAGSGVVTRALAPRLPPDARFVVTDLQPPMLERAKAQQPADDRIEWQQADALNLPFPDNEFDVVICQFGAMFFPEKPAGFAEARRVLKSGGQFIFSVWDALEHNVFARIATEVAEDLLGAGKGQFMARAPYGYFDRETLRADLAKAGFTQIEIETREAYSSAPSAEQVGKAMVLGTPLREEFSALGEVGLTGAVRTISERIAARFGPGAVSAPMRWVVVTCSV